MSTTTNMALNKPELYESANIQVLNANMDKLDGHRHAGGADGLAVKAVQAGGIAARPAYGIPGQLYVATDVPALYIDNGSMWCTVSGGGTAGEAEVTEKSSTTPNGTTTRFNIGNGAASTKVEVRKNGLVKVQGDDYTFTANANYVDFVSAPLAGDVVVMKYVPAA